MNYKNLVVVFSQLTGERQVKLVVVTLESGPNDLNTSSEEQTNFRFCLTIDYTGGTVSTKKLSLKSLALSGLFGAKWSLPKKSFS